MRSLHRTLHLQHHRHTGKVLHHKHTSYRGLAVVLALATACVIGVTTLGRATADVIHVYASLPAPIPTDQAIITSPHEADVVTNQTVRVTGTCPDITPHVIIGILDNGTLAGSVACDESNNFDLPIVIALGNHTLIARTYTITGDSGPDSEPVHITYVTSTTASGPVDTRSDTPRSSPLTLTEDQPFITFGPVKDAVWSGKITGGTLPYHVHIDWGDGTSNDYYLSKEGHQAFAHHYTAMHPYNIELHLLDASGRSILRNYSAITLYTPVTGLAPTTPSRPLPFQGSLPLGIYGIYLILLAIFGYLWITSHSFVFARPLPDRVKADGMILIAAKRRKRRDDNTRHSAKRSRR